MNDRRTRPLQLDEPIVTGNVKAAAKEAGATSSDLWKVPYDRIHYDPRDNVRPLDVEWAKHVGKLIAANGYDWSQPLHCYIRKVDGENLYYVTKGQHRYHGIGYAIAAGIDVGPIPVVVMEGKSVNRVDLIFDGLTSNESKRNSPLELAEKIAELRDVHGIDNATICERLQITDQTIRDLALLETAPSGLHKIVREGAVAGTLAIEEIRKHGPAKALERLSAAIVEAKAAGKTKATKKHVAKASTAPAPKKITELQAKSLLQALQAVLHDPTFGKLKQATIEGVHAALMPLTDLLDAVPAPTPTATPDKPAPREYPVGKPNEHGVYEAFETLSTGNAENSRAQPFASISIAQVAPDAWIHAIEYAIGEGGGSTPLTVYRGTLASWTRGQAIREGANALIDRLAPKERRGKAARDIKKLVEWAESHFRMNHADDDPDWTPKIQARFFASPKTHRPDISAVIEADEERIRARPFPTAALVGGSK